MAIKKLICTFLLAIASALGLQGNALPSDIKKLLDAHAAELSNILSTGKEHADARMGFNVCQKEWLPGYYIKYGIERVSNAQKVKDTIATHKLHLLSVPEKYIYPLPGTTGTLSNDNCLVIVKAVAGDHGIGKKLTVEHVRQLCKIAQHAHHYDLHTKNYILKNDGTLCIIDTDNHAMPSPEEVTRRQQDWIKNGTRIHEDSGVRMDPEVINHPLTKLELNLYSKHCKYNQQASSYIMNEVKKQEALRLQPNTVKRVWQIGAVLAAAYGMYKTVSALYTRWVKA